MVTKIDYTYLRRFQTGNHVPHRSPIQGHINVGKLTTCKLAEGVCHRSDYKEAPFLDTLAAAYAEVGRFQDAVKTATKAVEIGEAQGKIRLADDIRGRQKLYVNNQPYRSP